MITTFNRLQIYYLVLENVYILSNFGKFNNGSDEILSWALLWFLITWREFLISNEVTKWTINKINIIIARSTLVI